MIELQKTYTTPEQSKRLSQLGLPAESADMYYPDLEAIGDVPIIISRPRSIIFKGETPCWTNGRLMEILDRCCIIEGDDDPDFLDEWPTTVVIEKHLHISYVEYLVKTFEIAVEKQKIDFTKLE